jgi:hypothetical protein
MFLGQNPDAMWKLDRTTLSLVALAIAAAGVFAVFTKFNVPQLNAAFYGSNPFAIKRDAIESVMTWLFTIVALVGAAVQAVALVGEFEERLYASRTYVFVTIANVVGVAALVFALTWVGGRMARRVWEPLIIANQRELFIRADHASTHDGLMPEHLNVPSDSPEYNRVREAGVRDADRFVTQIENLLELSPSTGPLPQRIDRLRPYFR